MYAAVEVCPSCATRALTNAVPSGGMWSSSVRREFSAFSSHVQTSENATDPVVRPTRASYPRPLLNGGSRYTMVALPVAARVSAPRLSPTASERVTTGCCGPAAAGMTARSSMKKNLSYRWLVASYLAPMLEECHQAV